MSRQAFSPNNALDLLVVAFPKSFLSFGNFVAASGKKIESHENKLAKINHLPSTINLRVLDHLKEA
jgi:hypothetical protein